MATNLVTVECILSFPNLVTPRVRTDKDGKPKDKATYGAALVFPANVDREPFKVCVFEAATAKFGSKLEALVKGGKFKSPLLVDEEQNEKWGYGPGAVVIRASSPSRPGVVHRYVDPKTRKPRILSDEEITRLCYPGAIVRAELNAFGYDTDGNRGVAFGLNNLQWLEEGTRLDNKTNAEDAFSGEQQDTADLETKDPAVDLAAGKSPNPPTELAAKHQTSKSIMSMM